MVKVNSVIVALDNMNREEIENFLTQTKGQLPFIKIGLETFCRYGRSFIKEIAERFETRIFLDLKLHDIPNTVAKSIHALKGLPIEFLTIHLSGGQEMIKQALKAQRESLPNAKLLGVSYLTSLDGDDFLQIWGVDNQNISQQFKRLFELAHQTQIQGLVCSAQEADLLRSYELEKGLSPLLLVCPGIRFQDEIDQRQNLGDQKRVLSPQKAFEKKIDYLVMGRSLTQAKNLAQRLDELLELQQKI